MDGRGLKTGHIFLYTTNKPYNAYPPPPVPKCLSHQVFWDGREIGTTVVRRKTLNPIWVDENDNTCSNTMQHNTRQRKAAAKEEVKPYFWLESACSVNPRLRVEVYDWDAMGSHDFLGGVELDVEELVELQRATLGKARVNGGNRGRQVLNCLEAFVVNQDIYDAVFS